MPRLIHHSWRFSTTGWALPVTTFSRAAAREVAEQQEPDCLTRTSSSEGTAVFTAADDDHGIWTESKREREKQCKREDEFIRCFEPRPQPAPCRQLAAKVASAPCRVRQAIGRLLRAWIEAAIPLCQAHAVCCTHTEEQDTGTSRHVAEAAPRSRTAIAAATAAAAAVAAAAASAATTAAGVSEAMARVMVPGATATALSLPVSVHVPVPARRASAAAC